MLYGISVILSYILLIVSFIFVLRLNKGLSPSKRRANSKIVLLIFTFLYFLLTSNINSPQLQLPIFLIMLFNFIDFLLFLALLMLFAIVIHMKILLDILSNSYIHNSKHLNRLIDLSLYRM
jgi:phosphatidylserine synthase